MGLRSFDPERIKELNGPRNLRGKKLYYRTVNEVWWIEANVRKLPGGLRTSVEIWRETDSFQMIRYASWTYGITDDGPPEYSYTKRRYGDLPAYVISIGEELATILKRRHPLRGIGFASLHDEGR